MAVESSPAAGRAAPDAPVEQAVPPRRRRPALAEAGLAVLAMALATLPLVPLLELWRADLSVPLYTGEDSRFIVMLVKGMLETGGIGENPRLGAPFGQDLGGFPEVDNLSLLLLKALALVSSNPAEIVNVFFLLTFPLTALAAFVVLRAQRVSAAPAVACPALFALLPYHFLRNESHLFLSAYWAVPLACFLMLGLLGDEPLFERRARAEGPAWLRWASRRSLLTLAACVVVGSTWFYYSAFGAILVAAAAAVAVLVRRDRRTLAVAGVVVAAILATLALNLAPYAARQLERGAEPAYGKRSPAESEQLGLRLVQLVMPIRDHRIGRLARASRHYARTSPVYTEETAHLGVVGALGFAWLLVVAVTGFAAGARRLGWPRYGPAAGAALITFLFATAGGLGAVIAYALTPQLRAWNRLSIFIAFLSLLAVALTIDVVRRRARTGAARRGVAVAVAGGVLVIGVLDQTSPAFVPAYDQIRAEQRNDAEFARAIERTLPPGASVFQLPYVPFPEPPPISRLNWYDQLRGYLHTSTLRWSYGDVAGRRQEWRDDVSARPLGDALPALSAIGFQGIEVARRGYEDGGRRVEAALRRLLGVEPLVSPDRSRSFFDMRAYNDRLRATTPAPELAALREAALRPPAPKGP